MNSAHGQSEFTVRFDWGLDGAVAIGRGADVAVLVDVLSFTTTLSVAMDRGITVLPYAGGDQQAQSYAEQRRAALAIGRSNAADGNALSLSPASIRTHPAPPARIVLPSPNGSSIAHHFLQAGIACIGASLRNASAVATWLNRYGVHGQTVAFVAAGERWPNGNLRPAVEDAWGAGAIISGLAQLGWGDFSPEAAFGQATYERIHGDATSALHRCASGLELVARGYSNDVRIAGETDESSIVPRLTGEQFSAVETGPSRDNLTL